MKKIKWTNRYSDTMEADKRGRWARVAYAGNFNQPQIDGKKTIWEIAWIEKISNHWNQSFRVIYRYPCTSEILFASLDDAKAEVERSFRFFIDNCR
jgi:hypothetical protein